MNTNENSGNLKQRKTDIKLKFTNIPRVEYIIEDDFMAGAAISRNIRYLV
jgi:hypothetical protein